MPNERKYQFPNVFTPSADDVFPIDGVTNGSGGAVYLNGGCSYNTFSNGYYGGGTITLTSTCSGNAFNNIGGSTFTNSGTNNISKTTLF